MVSEEKSNKNKTKTARACVCERETSIKRGEGGKEAKKAELVSACFCGSIVMY